MFDQTHIPVLTLLGILYPIKSILELGSGDSTKVFLNEIVYSYLKRLDVVENGPQFCKDNLLAISKEHIKCVPFLKDGKMARCIELMDLDNYEMIFIDDSTELKDRVETIKYVTKKATSPLIVIHDFENEAYQQAVYGGYDSFVFDFHLPYTAVLTKLSYQKSLHKSFNTLIKSYYNEFQGDSIQWAALFQHALDTQQSEV